MPLVVELAVRLRAPIDREIKEYRRSWGRVTGVICVELRIGPDASRRSVSELVDSIKQLVMLQTRGVFRAVAQTSVNRHNAQSKFNTGFAALVGISLYRESELRAALTPFVPHLLKEPYLYFDNDSGVAGSAPFADCEE